MASFTVKQGGNDSCLCISTDIFYGNLYPAGQACSLAIARFTKGVPKRALEGVLVSPLRATNAMVIFPYLWGLSPTTACKTFPWNYNHGLDTGSASWGKASRVSSLVQTLSVMAEAVKALDFQGEETKQNKTKSTSHFYSGVGYRRVWKHKHAQVFPWLFCSGLQNPADRERTHEPC